MPTLHEAMSRHINYFLNVVEIVNDLFSEEKTQETGIKIFDRNREQIDLAIKHILRQAPSNETDLLLAQFVDHVSSVGMMRYSVTETLIPLAEQKILAAQRLGWKDLEADAVDGLGILYAFLGYLRQAIHYFEMAVEMAVEMADQAGEKDIKQDIQSHLKRARKQLANRRQSSAPKLLEMFRLILLRAKLFFAGIRRNPFSTVALLNRIASTYLTFEKWDRSIHYYEKSILISGEHSYRFGELEAAMGLLQAKISRDAGNVSPVFTGNVHNLIHELGFEWGTNFDVFETLLELTPAIRNVENIANNLANNHDPRASEIYSLLDQIMSKTNEIIVVATESSTQKDETFVSALQSIKDNLTRIVQISSEGTREP